jgi:hypothetical protein
MLSFDHYSSKGILLKVKSWKEIWKTIKESASSKDRPKNAIAPYLFKKTLFFPSAIISENPLIWGSIFKQKATNKKRTIFL